MCFSFHFDFRAVETFIRNKYEHKKYVKKDGIPPKPASSAAAASGKPEKV